MDRSPLSVGGCLGPFSRPRETDLLDPVIREDVLREAQTIYVAPHYEELLRHIQDAIAKAIKQWANRIT